VEALAKPVDGSQTIEFPDGVVPRRLVLEAAGLEAATREVLGKYSVPRAARLPDRPPPDPGAACGAGPALGATGPIPPPEKP
jgi:hypothetical protein